MLDRVLYSCFSILGSILKPFWFPFGVIGSVWSPFGSTLDPLGAILCPIGPHMHLTGLYLGSIWAPFEPQYSVIDILPDLDVSETNRGIFFQLQLDKYVKRLLEHGYTVPVIKQEVQAKGTDRSLACIYSPGMYFNDDSDNLSNNTICIWLNVSKSNRYFSGLSYTS